MAYHRTYTVMSLARELLRQFSRIYPAFEPVAEQITTRNNLMVNYPLALRPTGHRHSLVT